MWTLAPINGQTKMCLAGYNGQKYIVLSPFVTGWGPPCTYSLTMFGGFDGLDLLPLKSMAIWCHMILQKIAWVYQGLLSMSLFLG